jgi:hypothetical protein
MSSSPRTRSESKLLIRVWSSSHRRPTKISEYYSRDLALIVDRAELAIRCVLNRVGESVDIQRLCPNFDRPTRVGIRVAYNGCVGALIEKSVLAVRLRSGSHHIVCDFDPLGRLSVALFRIFVHAGTVMVWHQ